MQRGALKRVSTERRAQDMLEWTWVEGTHLTAMACLAGVHGSGAGTAPRTRPRAAGPTAAAWSPRAERRRSRAAETLTVAAAGTGDSG